MTTNAYVAMIIPDGSNQFFSRLAQLVQRELAQGSIGMLLLDSDSSPRTEGQYIRWVMDQASRGDVAALVYIPTGDSIENFEEVFSHDLPIVVLDREVPESMADRPIDQVLSSNTRGMRLVAEHLAERQIEKVAYIAGPLGTEPGRVRNLAFKEAWESTGGTIMTNFAGDFTVQGGQEVGEAILRLSEPPQALVAANDLMAIGAMQILQRQGLSIPDDLLVVGYDDIPLASWIYPTLTTVRQDVEAMARQAARHVTRRIDGDVGSGGLRTPIEPELIPRETTEVR